MDEITVLIPVPEGADWETITVKYVNPKYRKTVREEQSETSRGNETTIRKEQQ